MMNIFKEIILKSEDPSGTNRPLWYDTAYWQKAISAEGLRRAGCCGVAMRAVVGQLYTDPYFLANWTELKNSGIYRTGYGVYVPNQNWQVQLDNWYRVMLEPDVVPRVIDLEIQDSSVAPKKIADDMWRWIGAIGARDGRAPIIYSRANLVNQWLVPYWSAAQMNAVYWWLAQYTWSRITEHAGPPDLPKYLRRERVILHQTADKKPVPAGITPAKTIDWDRWEIGGELEMRDFIYLNWGGKVVEPEPEPEPEQGLEYRVCVDTLNIRSLPSSTSTDLGDLHQGDVIVAMDVGGGNSWILTQAGWVCKQQNTTRYLELVNPAQGLVNDD